MKYVVYFTAVLAAAIAAVMLLLLVNLVGLYNSYEGLISRIYFLVRVVLMTAVAAMAVVQLFRSTPRLMLIFAGAAFYSGLSLLMNQWVTSMIAASMIAEGTGEITGIRVVFMGQLTVLSLLMLTAGLLPALYEWIRHGLLVKTQPKRDVKKSLLITAGIMACIHLALSILDIAIQASELAPIAMTSIKIRMPSFILGLLFAIGLLVTCFLMKRRTGVLYRMFFIGLIVLGIVSLLFSLAWGQEAGMLMGIEPIDSLAKDLIVYVFARLAAVFVIIHAAKHWEDFAPPALTPQTYDEPEASAAE
jgi:hypothetical protein